MATNFHSSTLQLCVHVHVHVCVCVCVCVCVYPLTFTHLLCRGMSWAADVGKGGGGEGGGGEGGGGGGEGGERVKNHSMTLNPLNLAAGMAGFKGRICLGIFFLSQRHHTNSLVTRLL